MALGVHPISAQSSAQTSPPPHPHQVGTLWRSAYMLGAAYIFTIGGRNAWEKAADTYKSWRAVPAFRCADCTVTARCCP